MSSRVLCFDIGGTAIKAMLFDALAKPVTERIRILTPRPATPQAVLTVMLTISEMPSVRGKFSRISAGFPGVVKAGKTLNAPNLSSKWKDFPFQKTVERKFGVPVRVANDADVQSLAASTGKGLELTVTLGTGVGSGLVYEGVLIPNLELGHHPFRHGETYEEQLGKIAFEKVGKRRWNARVRKMIRALSIAFNYDRLNIGGGNAKFVRGKLPPRVRLIPNELGLEGGTKLWVRDLQKR